MRKTHKIIFMRSILLNHSQPMYKGYDYTYHHDHNEKLNVVTEEEGVMVSFVDSKLDYEECSASA